MKCQKCGNEIRETAKFCDECGTKNPNIRNKQKITNVPFSNKFIQKFLTNKNIIIASIVSIALFLTLVTIILVPYCTDSSSKKSNTNKTSKALEYRTTYKEYQLNDMTFKVPSDWDKSDAEKGYYFYDTSYNLLYVSSDTYDTYDKDYLDDSFFNGFINAFKETSTDYVELSRDYKNIDGIDALNVCFTCNLKGKDMYMNIYLFCKNGIIYEITFGSYGSSQSSDFNNAESEVLQSININETYTIEPPTEKPTEKMTEPPTEKPSSITAGKIKIFEDNELTVYYSDVEDYAYSDDEVLVYLLIENKTNQSLKFYADTVILDGISYNNVFCADLVSANSKGMIEINVEDCNNTAPKAVGTDLHYIIGDDYSNRVTLNIVSHDVK